LPDHPAGSNFTYAWVPAWADWAKSKGYWLEPGAGAARGDIVLFHWPGKTQYFDHIGVVQSYVPGAAQFATSEGNRGNQTVDGTRLVADAVGFIRLPIGGL
jgi:hypothetical protein